MLRLAEYFIVVGYDYEKSKHNESQGKVIQRLPKDDWPDYKFEIQVEMFCQPCGWQLSDVKSPPTFFVAYLTDTEAKIYYLACLSFHEAVSPSQLALGKHNSANSIHSSLSKKIHVQSDSHHIRNLSNCSAIQVNGDGKCVSEGNVEHDQDCPIEDPNLVKPADKFAPKSLILLARHGYFDVLKNCLSIIYTIYMDAHREISLEYVVSNILSAVDVPPIGGPRLSFTIGAGDKQVIQPSVCPTLPVTKSCVSMLFKHLGLQNVLLIFSTLINDQKILLYSRSLNRLTEACHSLRSLLYPLKYGNVFIPIIPKAIIDVLSTPTPFLAGVHTMYRPICDLTDVVMVDLDGGSVKYPESIPLVPLCEPYNGITIDSLTKILNPDLLTADEVYPPTASPAPDPVWQDKQLRAVFIRLFCRLFAGYRSCLSLTRIRPKPVIHFNESMFLLLRGLRNDKDEFMPRLLNCMSFGQLIQDRGTPYRVCDVFDEEYDSMTEILRNKSDALDDLAVIDKLAKKLYDNEYRGPPVVHQLPSEAKLGHTRLYAQSFQELDHTLVSDHIKTNLRNKSSAFIPEAAEPRFVAHGLELDKQIFKNEALTDKNKVIREFVANIFNNHITEALKRRNTIRQDLKNRLIRRIFIDELYRQLYPDQCDTFGPQYDLNIAPYNSEISCERKALLGYPQFELINDLMGEALRQEGQNEESGVVPIIMELSTKFCTQLNNIRYYSNMTTQIQDHPVWENQKFWLTCFCDQVNNEIRQLYLHHSESQYRQKSDRLSEIEKHAGNLVVNLTDRKAKVDKSWSHNAGVASQPSLAPKKNRLPTSSPNQSRSNERDCNRILYTNKMSALDMAAEEMKIIDIPDPEVQNQEEATVYAQILHFINLIVNFRIPLNIIEPNEQKTGRVHQQHQPMHAMHSDYGDGISMATSGSGGYNYDSESGYEDAGYTNTRISNLEIWLKKFVDKTASDNNLSPSTIENIKGKIDGIIEGHISNLESIYPEVQNIPKVKKVEVTSPVLLPYEKVILINNKESLRCHLLLDGRHEKLDLQRQREQDFEGLGGQSVLQGAGYVRQLEEDDDFDALKPLLPAQGALFITNYRVVFRGAPKDPYQSNKLVCRSFPISSLKSVKKLGMKSYAFGGVIDSQGMSINFITGRTTKVRGDGFLDVIRLRSNTFQMLKIGLEQEDSSPEIKDELTQKLYALRFPLYLCTSFNNSEKIDNNQQKTAYCTGLPEDTSSDIYTRQTSESISSMYSSNHNFSYAASPSIVSTAKQKRNFGRNTLRLAKETISRVKGRTSPSTITTTKYSESESERSSALPEDESRDFFLESSCPVTDAKILERLRALPGYQEYVRLFRISGVGGNCNINEKPAESVKMILNVIDRFPSVKSYQSMVIVPQSFTEAALRKVAKTHRKNRFPIITWRSSRTQAFLLRGAGFQAKGIMGKFLKQTASGQSFTPGQNSTGSQLIRNVSATLHRGFQTMTLKPGAYDGFPDRKPDQEITAAREQFRYLQELVKISPSYENIKNHLNNVDPLVPWTDSCRQNVIQTKKNPLEKAYQNLKVGGEKAKTLIKNEMFKRSSSNDELNKKLGEILGYTFNEVKYADEDTLSQHSFGARNGVINDRFNGGVFSNKEKGYLGRGVRGLLAVKFQTASLFRPASPTNLKTHLSKKTSDVSDEYIRSQSYNIPSHRKNSKESIASGVGAIDEAGEDDTSISTANVVSQGEDPNAHLTELRIVPLYILGEKSQIKNMSKSEGFHDIEFVSVDYTSKIQIKEAYEHLVKAALPDNVSSVPLMSHLPTSTSNRYPEQSVNLESGLCAAANKWLLQLQTLLELSGTVVDLIDIQSASVAVCLEDGWDATLQIVSLAQVMLDPHYRTLNGFWALIEKEWLMAGHKFSSRLSMTGPVKTNNFIPVFLQFLDAVHQLLKQFPMSFEFNDFFLRFLAYHHISNRFHNFKCDCEAERINWLRTNAEDFIPGSKLYDQYSILTYIRQHHEEWPVFFNFLFCPTLSQEVLRPCTNLSMIDIWEYYLNESLSSGSIYDLDHFSPSYRKRNSQHYDPILSGAFNNSHVESVYGILGLREGCEIRHWQEVWKKSCVEGENELKVLEEVIVESGNENMDENGTLKSNHSSTVRQPKISFNNDFIHIKEEIKRIRDVSYVEHKKTSLQRLEKRHLDNQTESQPCLNAMELNNFITNSCHKLQKLPTQFEFQTICGVCQNRSPPNGSSILKCSECKLTCHDKCIRYLPQECNISPKKPSDLPSTPVEEEEEDNINPIPIATSETVTPVSAFSSQTLQSHRFSDILTEKCDADKNSKLEDHSSETTFSGELWKLSQHTLFPSWQKKYFVLDVIRHRLRYTDLKDPKSSSTKFIDLQNITGVRILTTIHNHQKKFPESAFLELETDERTYKLASESPASINEWMEKIQNSIQ